MIIGGNDNNQINVGSGQAFTITDKKNLDADTAARHTHENTDVIDGISAEDIIAWNSKQDVLTFDTTPTANSTNPVTSGGVQAALDTKQDKIATDETATYDNIIVADGKSANIKRTGYHFVNSLAGDPSGVPTDEAVQNFTLSYAYSKNESDAALATKEDVANKTQSISDTSTETQYPSAKAVNDAIKSKVGGIYRPKGSCNSNQFQHDIMPLDHVVGDVYSIETSGTVTVYSDLSSKALNGMYEGNVFYFNDPDYKPSDAFRVGEDVVFPAVMNSVTITGVDDDYNCLYLNASHIAEPLETAIHSKTYTLNINAGDNVVWTTAGWDKLGANVDLSNYYTKTATDNAIKAYTYSKAESDASLVTKKSNFKLLNRKTVTGTDDFVKFNADTNQYYILLNTTDGGAAYSSLGVKHIYANTYIPQSETTSSTSINATYVGGSTSFSNVCFGCVFATDGSYCRNVELDLNTLSLMVGVAVKRGGYFASMQWHTGGLSGGLVYNNSNAGERPISALQWAVGEINLPFPVGSYIEVWGVKYGVGI